MKIAEIAKYVWEQSHSFCFGLESEWDANLFTKPWAEARTPAFTWRTYGPGWYWFIAKVNYSELNALPRPQTLPKSGCDIGAVSHANLGIFGKQLLCAPDAEDRLVVYNGHEGNISSRVRAHFALQNDRTGALGLKHFPLSQWAWEVRVFSTPCLGELNGEEAARVQSLMNSKSGRCAVETAWRAEFGWPILCKE